MVAAVERPRAAQGAGGRRQRGLDGGPKQAPGRLVPGRLIARRTGQRARGRGAAGIRRGAGRRGGEGVQPVDVERGKGAAVGALADGVAVRPVGVGRGGVEDVLHGHGAEPAADRRAGSGAAGAGRRTESRSPVYVRLEQVLVHQREFQLCQPHGDDILELEGEFLAPHRGPCFVFDFR